MALSQANFENEIGWALATNSDRMVLDKASLPSQVAGGFCSMWRATGIPGQGAIPAAAAICTKALTGAVNFNNQVAPMTSYFAWAYYVAGTAGHAAEVHDRLAHMGGLSGTVTTAQNVNLDLSTLGGGLVADRRGDANYSDVMWWLEWYQATGATAVNATVNVTYDDASTGNIVIAVASGTAGSRMIPIISAVAGRFIRGINTVTLSATTGTGGNFGVTASRQRTAMENDVANKGKTYTWAMLGIPEIPNDSCLFFIVPCSTTSTGTLRGQGKIAHV
jgi:hypothetical protein